MTSFPLLLLVAAMAIALWLLLRGLRGKRIGNEPHCRKCNYDLTSLTSDRCPECGWAILAERVRHGRRRRRPWSILLGSLLLAGELTIAVVIARGMNWWPCAPTWVVLKSADWGNKAAYAEMDSRFQNKKLSRSQIDAIAEVCLVKQKTCVEKQTAAFDDWMELLDELNEADLLSPQQRERYYRQFTGEAKLSLRPRIRVNDQLPMKLQVAFEPMIPQGRASRHMLVMMDSKHEPKIEIRQRVAGEEKADDSNLHSFAPKRSSTSGGFQNCIAGRNLFIWNALQNTRLEPGSYRLHFCSDLCILHTIPTDEPARRRKLELQSDFEVLPPGTPDTVKLVCNSQLKKEMEHCIRIRKSASFPGQPPFKDSAYHLSFKLDNSWPLPIQAAFELHVMANNKDFYIGSRLLGINENDDQPLVHRSEVSQLDFDATDAMVLLRPDPDAARQTVDMFEIYGEEITRGPVKVGKINSKGQ